MSPWLEQLGLDKSICLGSKASTSSRAEPPEWAEFLIWIGWWMRRNLISNGRMFVILLLPTRRCCSALSGLGALIGSMDKKLSNLSWDALQVLSPNTKVYLRLSDRKAVHGKTPVEGRIRGAIDIQGKKGVRIEIESQIERFKELSITVLPANCDQYQISLSPYPSGRKEKTLAGISRFFGAALPAFDGSSMLVQNSECVIVTNRSAWERDADGLYATIQDGSSRPTLFPLVDLLMAGSVDSEQQSRTALVSPKSESGDSAVPLAILDGPESLRSYEKINSSNVLILLEHTEYDESAQNIIANLVSARSDEALLSFEKEVSEIPEGIELALFAIRFAGV